LRYLPIPQDPHVLSSFSSQDDAAVYQISADLAVVQTVDYITPIVDDPYTFGAIAAANALSDIYAMGARPVTALNLVGYPIKTLPIQVLGEILRGGADKVIEAGASLVGGHSIEDNEPKYGLAVMGLVHPDRIIRKKGAQPGDVLVLTKPLGTGIITTGVDRGLVGVDTISAVTRLMTTLNRVASEAMQSIGVHAATDVTGFGLFGHLLELLIASDVGAEIDFDQIPVLPEAWDLARQDVIPEGSRNNYHYVIDSVDWLSKIPLAAQMVLCDAQTSGGLLIALPTEKANQLLDRLRTSGNADAQIIGEIITSPNPAIRVLRK
jgi:selenide,water dikinase